MANNCVLLVNDIEYLHEVRKNLRDLRHDYPVISVQVGQVMAGIDEIIVDLMRLLEAGSAGN